MIEPTFWRIKSIKKSIKQIVLTSFWPEKESLDSLQFLKIIDFITSAQYEMWNDLKFADAIYGINCCRQKAANVYLSVFSFSSLQNWNARKINIFSFTIFETMLTASPFLFICLRTTHFTGKHMALICVVKFQFNSWPFYCIN
jgi:hypothetical protein